MCFKEKFSELYEISNEQNKTFFECTMARYVWILVTIVVGALVGLALLNSFRWVHRYMPNHKYLHMVGLSAICWAFWRVRNSMCFVKTKKG